MANKELQETVQKVGHLLRLAGDDKAAPAEAHNAAKSALALIEENELVLIPKSEFERAKAAVQGNAALAKQVQETRQKSLVLGGVLGFMFGGGKLGRFGR